MVKSYTRRVRHGRTIVHAHRRSNEGRHKKVNPTIANIPVATQKKICEDNSRSIMAELKKVDKAKVPHLGILVVKKKPAQKGGVKKYSPMLGKDYITKSKPASKTIKFRPSKELKEYVN